MYKLALLVFLIAVSWASAVTPDNFTNGAHDSSWSNTLNWNNGLPNSQSAVTIATQPSGNLLGIDTGSANNSVYSFTFGGTMTGAIQVLPAGPEQLQISNSLVNASSFTQEFGLYVGMLGNSVQSGANGLVFSGGLGLTQSTTNNNTGAITLGADAPFLLTLGPTAASLTTAGTVNFNGSDLVLNTTTTYANGSSFNLVTANARSGHFAEVTFTGSYTGSFTQVSPGVWTATSGGQTWQFHESTGVLSNVPEPSVALLGAAGLLMLGGRKNRRRAR